MKNTKKSLFFNNFKASKPKISETVTFSFLLDLGGVNGKIKLNKPRTAEAIPAIKKVLRKRPPEIFAEESQWKI